MSDRSELTHSRRWVIKIGSSLLTDGGRGLHREAIAGWVAQIATLRARGCGVVLVSSGAVAEGMTRLGWKTRPVEVHRLQAAAAVGQMGLVQTWESFFQQHGLHTAQVLLVHDDLANRGRYLNARSTLRTLLELGVVPVVNENDTVATDEIRFGDNDTLGALVANLIEADVLLLLTDQPGLFERDPRQDPSAPLVNEAEAHDAALDAIVAGMGPDMLQLHGHEPPERVAAVKASGCRSRSCSSAVRNSISSFSGAAANTSGPVTDRRPESSVNPSTPSLRLRPGMSRDRLIVDFCWRASSLADRALVSPPTSRATRK